MRLHEVTALTRKAFIFIASIIAILIVGRLLLGIGNVIKEQLFPIPPVPPSVLFGTLPEIEFPKQTSIPKLSFTINTIEGSLPTFPSLAKVYKLTTPQPSLLSLAQTRDTVANLSLIHI